MWLEVKKHDLPLDEPFSPIFKEKRNSLTSILLDQLIVRQHMGICQNEQRVGE